MVKSVKPYKFVVSIYGIFERFPLMLKSKILYPLHLYRYRYLDRAFKGGADVFLICDDGSMGDRLAEKYGVNYKFLPNPKPDYKPIPREKAREIMGINFKGVLGAFVGRFSKFKGVQYLPRIYRKGDPYKLIIVGKGFSGDFKRWAEEVNSIIIEQFPHNRMNIVYSGIDFVIMPYIYGNKTTVMVESLTYGLPTVSFKAHTTDQIIKNNYNGFIAKNFNLYEFRKYCLSLAKDRSLREGISPNARKTSLIFPTWDNHISQIINTLKTN